MLLTAPAVAAVAALIAAPAAALAAAASLLAAASALAVAAAAAEIAALAASVFTDLWQAVTERAAIAAPAIKIVRSVLDVIFLVPL